MNERKAYSFSSQPKAYLLVLAIVHASQITGNSDSYGSQARHLKLKTQKSQGIRLLVMVAIAEKNSFVESPACALEVHSW